VPSLHTRFLRLALPFLLGATPCGWAQDKPRDSKVKWVEEIADQARSEIRAYRHARKPQGEHPGKKWGEFFWSYYLSHGSTPATRAAASQAFWMFYEADMEPEVFARAEQMDPVDPAWEEAVVPFYRACNYRREWARFIARAKAVLAETESEETKLEIQFHLGLAYLDTKDSDSAKAAFEAVIKEKPDSNRAKVAKRHIYEILHINVGQVAPGFKSPATNGAQISLEDYRGKVLLLNFWASW